MNVNDITEVWRRKSVAWTSQQRLLLAKKPFQMAHRLLIISIIKYYFSFLATFEESHLKMQKCKKLQLLEGLLSAFFICEGDSNGAKVLMLTVTAGVNVFITWHNIVVDFVHQFSIHNDFTKPKLVKLSF